jgi:hypothetical protein
LEPHQQCLPSSLGLWNLWPRGSALRAHFQMISLMGVGKLSFQIAGRQEGAGMGKYLFLSMKVFQVTLKCKNLSVEEGGQRVLSTKVLVRSFRL